MSSEKQFKVQASKQFSVAPEKIYKAWTEADQLKQWWKPMGNTLTEVTNELKSGGAVKYVFDTNAFVISGQYSEVQENEKLVYSWNWEFPKDEVKNVDYKLTVEFTAYGEGSAINILQEGFDNEESLQPHQEGWNKGLNDLDTYLSGHEPASGSAASVTIAEEYASAGETPKDSSGGYREAPDQVKVGGE